VSYRELSIAEPLRALAECAWVTDAPEPNRVLPDGCMDLIRMRDRVWVAGPDTRAFVSERDCGVATGIRFRPGVLPRLLDIPAVELRDNRVELELLRPNIGGASLMAITARFTARLLEADTTRGTAPWRLAVLHRVTERLGSGAAVHSVADEIGWSARNLQRQCAAVYGYGPATLRRILRFRKAVRLLGAGIPAAETAALAGYADQSHLSRQMRELSGISATQLGNGA